MKPSAVKLRDIGWKSKRSLVFEDKPLKEKGTKSVWALKKLKNIQALANPLDIAPVFAPTSVPFLKIPGIKMDRSRKFRADSENVEESITGPSVVPISPFKQQSENEADKKVKHLEWNSVMEGGIPGALDVKHYSEDSDGYFSMTAYLCLLLLRFPFREYSHQIRLSCTDGSQYPGYTVSTETLVNLLQHKLGVERVQFEEFYRKLCEKVSLEDILMLYRVRQFNLKKSIICSCISESKLGDGHVQEDIRNIEKAQSIILSDKSGKSKKYVAKLEITIFKCRNLLGKDRSGFSDPFCAICYTKHKQSAEFYLDLTSYDIHKRTKVKKKTLNPEWNESFAFNIEDAFGLGQVEIMIWDRDMLSKNDFLGKTSLSLHKAPFNTTVHDWYSLEQRSSRSRVQGDINFSYRLSLLERKKKGVYVDLSLMQFCPHKVYKDFVKVLMSYESNIMPVLTFEAAWLMEAFSYRYGVDEVYKYIALMEVLMANVSKNEDEIDTLKVTDWALYIFRNMLRCLGTLMKTEKPSNFLHLVAFKDHVKSIEDFVIFLDRMLSVIIQALIKGDTSRIQGMKPVNIEVTISLILILGKWFPDLIQNQNFNDYLENNVRIGIIERYYTISTEIRNTLSAKWAEIRKKATASDETPTLDIDTTEILQVIANAEVILQNALDLQKILPEKNNVGRYAIDQLVKLLLVDLQKYTHSQRDNIRTKTKVEHKAQSFIPVLRKMMAIKETWIGLLKMKGENALDDLDNSKSFDVSALSDVESLFDGLMMTWIKGLREKFVKWAMRAVLMSKWKQEPGSKEKMSSTCVIDSYSGCTQSLELLRSLNLPRNIEGKYMVQLATASGAAIETVSSAILEEFNKEVALINSSAATSKKRNRNSLRTSNKDKKTKLKNADFLISEKLCVILNTLDFAKSKSVEMVTIFEDCSTVDLFGDDIGFKSALFKLKDDIDKITTLMLENLRTPIHQFLLDVFTMHKEVYTHKKKEVSEEAVFKHMEPMIAYLDVQLMVMQDNLYSDIFGKLLKKLNLIINNEIADLLISLMKKKHLLASQVYLTGFVLNVVNNFFMADDESGLTQAELERGSKQVRDIIRLFDASTNDLIFLYKQECQKENSGDLWMRMSLEYLILNKNDSQGKKFFASQVR